MSEEVKTTLNGEQQNHLKLITETLIEVLDVLAEKKKVNADRLDLYRGHLQVLLDFHRTTRATDE